MSGPACPECGRPPGEHDWTCSRLSDKAIVVALAGEGWGDLVEGVDY